MNIINNNKLRAEIEAEFNQLKTRYHEELENIKNKSTTLFPKDWILDKNTTDTFRALCTLSQSGLVNTHKVSSHRKIIGPIIVFFKKILLKIIDSQMKNTLNGISSCFTHIISNQAKLEVELKEIRKKTLEN